MAETEHPEGDPKSESTVKRMDEIEQRGIAGSGEFKEGSGSLRFLGLPSDAPAPSAALEGPAEESTPAGDSSQTQNPTPEE